MKKDGNNNFQTTRPVETIEQQPAPAKTEAAIQTEPKPEVTKEEQTETATESTADYDHEIVSPMVGTLYSAPSPESDARSEEHTSELQSRGQLVCRPLL